MGYECRTALRLAEMHSVKILFARRIVPSATCAVFVDFLGPFDVLSRAGGGDIAGEALRSTLIYGSVRGVPGKRHPYRDRASTVRR